MKTIEWKNKNYDLLIEFMIIKNVIIVLSRIKRNYIEKYLVNSDSIFIVWIIFYNEESNLMSLLCRGLLFHFLFPSLFYPNLHPPTLHVYVHSLSLSRPLFHMIGLLSMQKHNHPYCQPVGWNAHTSVTIGTEHDSLMRWSLMFSTLIYNRLLYIYTLHYLSFYLSHDRKKATQLP